MTNTYGIDFRPQKHAVVGINRLVIGSEVGKVQSTWDADLHIYDFSPPIPELVMSTTGFDHHWHVMDREAARKLALWLIEWLKDTEWLI